MEQHVQVIRLLLPVVGLHVVLFRQQAPAITEHGALLLMPILLAQVVVAQVDLVLK